MITPKNILPVSTVKRDLLQLLKKLQTNNDPLVITKDGKAQGVLLSAEIYESLMETLDILRDKALIKSLTRSQQDFEKGRTYSHEQVFGE